MKKETEKKRHRPMMDDHHGAVPFAIILPYARWLICTLRDYMHRCGREGRGIKNYFFGAGFVVLVAAADVALMPRASFTACVRSSAVLPVASSVPDSKI